MQHMEKIDTVERAVPEPGNQPVHQATSGLQRSLDIVQNRVEDLEHRLSPVLGPEYTSKQSTDLDPMPMSEHSPMTETIGLAADHAERLAFRLQTLLDRLEI